ncbi:MAG: RHS repeat-associated core domain-containing protein, partial [Phycisphaerales bacterium]
IYNDTILFTGRRVDIVEPIPEPLSTATGCKVRGYALSAKKVLDVLEHASEPFPPPAFPTDLSLGLVTKQVPGLVLDNSSLKIQYNRNRYYDQYTGRWTTEDPFGYVDGMGLYEYVASAPTNQLDPYGNLSYMQITLIIDMQMAIALDLLARGYSVQEVAAMTGLPVEKVIMLYLALQRRSREMLDRLRNVGIGILQQVAKNLEARQHARGPLEPGGPGPRGWRPPKPPWWVEKAIDAILTRGISTVVTTGKGVVEVEIETARTLIRAQKRNEQIRANDPDEEKPPKAAVGLIVLKRRHCRETCIAQECKGCEGESLAKCKEACWKKCDKVKILE